VKRKFHAPFCSGGGVSDGPAYHTRYWVTHRHPVWLFPSPYGVGDRLSTAKQPITTRGVQRAFERTLQECGIQKPVTVHSLRHAFGRPFGCLINAS
jgi:integrase